ncbi:hypothetical protein CC78DRAFT_529422 [Lojkania enalia]|uniref:25S rRNA (Uridine(2843)-N(3))-methyltransferase n=1 Tax=Lojkania enalia TaxID=147567 RepID=A0A9P4N9N4_9PLEO|nr:hypothetical protein CC78DRAFT_529422 [Didymosphaeria enalia]
MPPPKAKNKKSTKSSKLRAISDKRGDSQVPVDLQQLLLNIFKNSFSERLHANIQPLLQEVKGHLYNRDFLTAFGRDDYLEAYAARWSPSRALGYLQVLVNVQDRLETISKSSNEENKAAAKVVCLGGGAGAEIVALGGFLNLLNRSTNAGVPSRIVDIVAIDIANWTAVVENLRQNIVTAPPLSNYASAAAHSANSPLAMTENLVVSFHQHDILSTDFAVIGPLIEDAGLITIMFTLNELYSTSLSLTQKFLLNLTRRLKEGALLLVADSPGSYSTVSLNGAEKKYPMQWLLDHTLLRQGSKGEEPMWMKIEEDESKWFRLPPSLSYPIDLENMRFQMHLYRRI